MTFLVLLVLFTMTNIRRVERMSRIDPAIATPLEMQELNIGPVNYFIGGIFTALLFAAVIAVPTDLIRRWRYHRRAKRSQSVPVTEQPVATPFDETDT